MNSASPNLLYLAFTLGGVGVFFLLPRTGSSKAVVGTVFAALGLALLLAILATGSVSVGSGAGLFYLLAMVSIFAAVRVITHPKPMYSAIYFLVVVLAVAALLVMQHAEFLAIALIIIYAGAILVTYLFVIMLAQQPGSPLYDRRAREPLWAVLIGFVLLAAITGKMTEPLRLPSAVIPVSQTDAPPPTTVASVGNTASLGSLLLTKYVVVLQMAGLLLLISMIGAIALSRKRILAEGYPASVKPLGQAGREVEPF